MVFGSLTLQCDVMNRCTKLLQLHTISLIVIMVAVWAVKRQCLEKVSHDIM